MKSHLSKEFECIGGTMGYLLDKRISRDKNTR